MKAFISCVIACSYMAIFACAQPVVKPEKLTVLKDVPSELLFRESQNFSLTCPVERGLHNVLGYFWFKDGEFYDVISKSEVVEGTDLIPNSINITSASKEHEGKYRCMVVTSLGEPVGNEVSVIMTYMSTPRNSLEKHKPIEGRPFKLDCPIPDAYPKPSIKWVSRSINDPTNETTILHHRKTLSPDGTLWFSNVTAEDASKEFKYVCVAESPAVVEPVVLAEHIIEGVEKDKEKQSGELVPQYLSKDMVAKVGDVTMIYCIFGGTYRPLAFPDWYKDGTNVNNPGDRVTRYNNTGGKRLLIKQTLKEDEGTYTCSAYNEVGKSVNHTIKLTVVAAPEITIKPEQLVQAKKGQDVTLTCKAVGDPTPNITWTKNFDKVESWSKVEIKETELVLKDVDSKSTGYYGCSAVNDYGTAYAETLLDVGEA